MDKQTKAKLNSLLKHIQSRQNQICEDNQCRDDEHNCGSCAYINEDYNLLDLCLPDYFQGSSKPYAAIPLPIADDLTVSKFKQEIDEELSE